MARTQQKLIHLHGTTQVAEGTNGIGLLAGEIAVRNAAAGAAELYVTDANAQNIVAFVDRTGVNAIVNTSAATTKREYEAADTLLGDRITALEGKVTGDKTVAEQIKAAVDAEAALREAADIDLQGQVDAKVAQTAYDAKIAELAKADSDEATARANADTALSERIAAFETGNNSVAKQIETAVNTEKQAREAADTKIREDFAAADTKVTEDIIGKLGDASSADTIYGAKKYAEEKAEAAKTAVQGTANDASSAATVAGAKKYAEEKAEAAKTAVQGTADDTKDSATVAGAKKYTDAEIKDLTDETITPHINNTTVHISAQERLDWNQAKTDIDYFFKEDAKIEGTIDTLREIQEWLSNTANKDASDIIQAISDEATTRKDADDALDLRLDVLEGKFAGDNSVQNQINGLQTQITDITKEGGELDQHQAAAEANVIGKSGDASTANTIYGAKAYAKAEATTAKSEAISAVKGTADDTKDSATVAGAKKYADEKAATAKSEAISAVKGTSSDNKDSETVAGAKKYADHLDAEMDKRVDVLEAATHTHSNKTLLDTYTQTEANLADAVSKKHSHDNKTTLDKITEANLTAWSSAEANAKRYVDDLGGGATSKEGTYVTVQVTSAGGKVKDVIVTENFANLVIDCGTYDA